MLELDKIYNGDCYKKIKEIPDKSIFIASCSFGKDSLAQIILAYLNNEPIDFIIYCEVMFSHQLGISGELPEHRDFIYNVAIQKIEKEFGYKVIVVKSEDDFLSEFNRVITRGSRKGQIRAFPIGRKCQINRDLKVKPIRDFYKSLDTKNIYQYVGIAIDEKERLEKLHKKKNTISILEKYKYTEDMAYELCKKYGLLSPIYEFTKRNGCWFCPNQRICELVYLYKNHNDLFMRLVELGKTPNKASEKWNRTDSINDVHRIIKILANQISIFEYLEEQK